MTTNTEYRNELGDTTTDPAVADGWSDAALEVDERDGPDAPWRPSNYEGEHAVTAERIAHYAAREAAIAAPPRQEPEERTRAVALLRAAGGWKVRTHDGAASHDSEVFPTETEARAYAAARAARVFGAG